MISCSHTRAMALGLDDCGIDSFKPQLYHVPLARTFWIEFS